jgi:hypothetical protein
VAFFVCFVLAQLWFGRPGESTLWTVFVLLVLLLVCDSVSEQSKVAFARVVRPDFPESIGDLPCGYNVFLTS